MRRAWRKPAKRNPLPSNWMPCAAITARSPLCRRVHGAPCKAVATLPPSRSVRPLRPRWTTVSGGASPDDQLTGRARCASRSWASWRSSASSRKKDCRYWSCVPVRRSRLVAAAALAICCFRRVICSSAGAWTATSGKEWGVVCTSAPLAKVHKHTSRPRMRSQRTKLSRSGLGAQYVPFRWRAGPTLPDSRRCRLSGCFVALT